MKAVMKSFITLMMVALIIYTMNAGALGRKAFFSSKGWSQVKSPEIAPRLERMLQKGLNGMCGVDHDPVAYVGSKGFINKDYEILCKSSAVVPKPKPEFVILVLDRNFWGFVDIKNYIL